MIERLRAAAPALFAGTPVRFAYLCGSYACGTAGPRSDVDVAVHLAGAEMGTDLLLELVGRLERLTGVETDVIVLDVASLRLVHRVLAQGLVLYGADEPCRVRYEATTRRRAVLDRLVVAQRAEAAQVRRRSSRSSASVWSRPRVTSGPC